MVCAEEGYKGLDSTFMSNFKEKISKQLDDLRRKNLSNEERAVMTVLWVKWQRGTGKATQTDIAKAEPWMKCHEKYEQGVVINPDETTLRKVRQIIRDLRVIHFAPILSDRHGYWIPTSENEVDAYLKRIESEAKAQIKSWIETGKSMKIAFGVTSQFLNDQQTIWPTE